MEKCYRVYVDYEFGITSYVFVTQHDIFSPCFFDDLNECVLDHGIDDYFIVGIDEVE